MNHQQEPPKHFGLPEGLHGGPIPEHAQGGEYARLDPLPHYNPVCHRSRGWLHLFFCLYPLLYIIIMKYKKNQEENFIFECVREILFLYQFTVRTLYIFTRFKFKLNNAHYKK